MSETAMAVVQLDADQDHQPENGFVSPDPTSPSVLARIDDCVLPFLGGFGNYQRHLIVLTWIPAIFIGFSQYSDNFLLAQPNNTCVHQPTMANVTNVTSRSHSALFHAPHNSSTRPAFIYANGSYGTHNDTANMQCMCKEWTFELQTGLVRNVVTKWSLVCDSAWKVHIAKFSLLVGSIFGYLVFGVLADWFGRHPVLIISVLFMLVFGLTVAFSVNVPMFSTLRFFEGFCLAGINLSLYVLRIELCLPGWRFSMTMVANFVILGGQLAMPGVAYLCRDWQVLQAVIICPLLLMLSYIWIFPESLRWLLATQQYCRSKWIMGYIAKKNQANVDFDADQILTELQRSLQKKPKRTCIVKMVGTRNLWKNIVVLCVNSLTGYGIHHCFARSMMDDLESPLGNTNTMFHNFYADYYTMAGIAVASLLALCPAVGLMGRRGGLLMFMIITALASLLQLGLLNLLGKYSSHLNIERSDTLNRNFSIAFSIIGMFSSHAVSNLSIFFCAEITPTVIRGGGLGLVLASAGFGMLTAPIMELHNQKGYFLHHVIFACCTLICIICILLLPETRYQPLPETLMDGESYVRQPQLLSRRPGGEQLQLLAQAESNRSMQDYTLVNDTPLHEGAGPPTAVATMDSTASSAVDLTAPSVIDISVPASLEVHKVELKDPNGRSPPVSPSSITVAGLDKGCILLASKEHLLLSTPPLHKAPCVKLLTGAEDDSATTPLMGSMEPSTDLPAPAMRDAAPSPDKEAAATSGPAMETQPTSLVDESLPTSPSLPATPPVVEPPPASSAAPLTPVPPESTIPPEPPVPPADDIIIIDTAPLLDVTTPPCADAAPAAGAVDPVVVVVVTLPARDHHQPPTPPATPSPAPDASVPAAPLPSSDGGVPADPDVLLQIDSESVDESMSVPSIPHALPSPRYSPPAPAPAVDSVQTPQLDSTSPCAVDVSPAAAPAPLPPPSPPPPPPHVESDQIPPVDRYASPAIDAVGSATPPPIVLPVTDTVRHASPPAAAPTTTTTTTLLTVTDVARPSLDSATSLAVDSASNAATDCDPPPASIVDCTVSSPIDSGVAPITDCAITENNIVNGVTSS